MRERELHQTDILRLHDSLLKNFKEPLKNTEWFQRFEQRWEMILLLPVGNLRERKKIQKKKLRINPEFFIFYMSVQRFSQTTEIIISSDLKESLFSPFGHMCVLSVKSSLFKSTVFIKSSTLCLVISQTQTPSHSNHYVVTFILSSSW